MNGFVFAGITPHGFSIVEDIAGKDYELFKPIREGMKIFGEKFKKHNIDTIIILTPHGLKLKGHNAIYTTCTCKGTLSQYGLSVFAEYKCDLKTTQTIIEKVNNKGISLIGCNFGAMSGDLSSLPIDWGTFIPLWFCCDKENKRPEIVVISPSRETPIEKLIQMGKIIGEVAENSEKKIALIASCDQSHTHDVNSPYGYTLEAKFLDDIIIKIVKENRLDELQNIDEEFIKKAKPDSIWQMLILYGALQYKKLKHNFITYQCPTYFGMLIASYE